MAYSIPYILVLTFFGISAFIFEFSENEERKRNVVLLSIVVFYVFFAFRGYVYTDWTNYAEFLDEVQWGDLLVWTGGTAVVREPGFTLLCLLCKSVVNEYAFLVIVCTTIDLWLFLRFLRRWEIENVAFVFMLFLTFNGVGIMFNLMRNTISIMIFLNALEFIVKRKPLPYFLLCLLALSFHLSSILYVPLYFFLHRRINKWVLLGLFLSFFAFYVSQISIVATAIQVLGIEGTLGEKIMLYTETFTSSRTLSLSGTLEKCGLVTLLVLYYDDIIATNKWRLPVINSLVIYFFMFFILAEFYTLSVRLSDLFVFAYWVLWIDVVKILFFSNNRKLLAGLIYLYCLYILVFNIHTPVQEYDNLLFGAKSQYERRNILQSTYEDDEQ